MKKIIYFLAVVGLTTIIACSDEEKLPTIRYDNCQVCEVDGVAPDYIPEDYELCVATHTIELDTTATDTIDNPVTLTYQTVYVDGADTNLPPIEYFSLFCNNAYNPDAGVTPGGGGGTNENCVSCAAFTQNSQQFPAEEVCQGTNGNAFVGTTDTGMTFATYVAAKEILTDCQ